MLPRLFCHLLLLACTIALGACSEWLKTGQQQEFTGRGIIRAFSPDGKRVTIQHEKIAGYTPERTMEFRIKKQRDFAGLRTGQGISFRLVVRENDTFVDRVHTVSAEQVWVTRATPTPAAMAGPQTGSSLPQPR